MKLLSALYCILLTHQIHAKLYRRINQIRRTSGLQLRSLAEDVAVGNPLILTSYLKEGKIKEAQAAALVPSDKFLGITSYSGYFTVDDRFNSNLWFWFFPSTSGHGASDPVLLWLSGDPGESSLNGVFEGNGPFIVDDKGKLVSLSDYSWNKNQSIIYIDSPVGVGYSFTNGGLALNETKVGEDLHSALTQFFELFPDLQKNDFFIGGESYSGKYVPAAAYTILKKNPQSDAKINLKGILIGNGWTDPIHQIDYAPYVYNNGLVSAIIADQIAKMTKYTIQKMNEGDYLEARKNWVKTTELIADSDQISFFNYIRDYDFSSSWPDFVVIKEIRKAIHVGNITFGDKGARDALNNDYMQSVAPWMETLLANYRVLIYTGQFDISCGYPMVLNYLKHLSFTGAEEFKKANRTVWLMDSEPAGYVRIAGNLTELFVRNAGALVPRDQPVWASEMVFRFTRNAPFV